MTSMIPDPQMPVTPVLATFAGERRIVGPHVDTDHLEPRLERDGIDAHALDRARRGALTRADLGPLERGAGRARRRELLMPVPEHDLGVGADIDEQLHVLGSVRSLRQDRPRGVGADVAGDARSDVDAGVGQRQVEVARRRHDGSVGGERERRLPQRRRVDAEHDVVHDRVADEHDFEHAIARVTGALRAARRRARRARGGRPRSARGRRPGSSSRTRPGS